MGRKSRIKKRLKKMGPEEMETATLLMNLNRTMVGKLPGLGLDSGAKPFGGLLLVVTGREVPSVKHEGKVAVALKPAIAYCVRPGSASDEYATTAALRSAAIGFVETLDQRRVELRTQMAKEGSKIPDEEAVPVDASATEIEDKARRLMDRHIAQGDR